MEKVVYELQKLVSRTTVFFIFPRNGINWVYSMGNKFKGKIKSLHGFVA
jgi:hypothetical protein